MVLYSTRIQIVTWLRLMQAGQTYSWVLTFKHTFHGTKHLSHAFSDQQRKTRIRERDSMRTKQEMPHFRRSLGVRKCRRR